MQWEVVIGLETHTQLTTQSKIFSGSAIRFGAQPNTQASPVDLALPGVLPVMNRGAVERAIRFGLAIGATIAPQSIFARKNYFYPDLPKGYQISQYEIPVVQGGTLSFMLEKDGKPELRTVQLTRAHLEEDAGKSLHEDYQGMTGIDLNRAGTPLLEIVTEPVMHSAAEAVAYAKALHALVTWLGICDGNMQEGSFRCDANVSVRKAGDEKLGTRCEIKNLNSFHFMEKAIEFEARRQIELIDDGKAVSQETRLYDPDKNETRSMRSKEDAQDYRYFPDPDLLPLVISESEIDRIRSDMPVSPEVKRKEYESMGVSPYQAALLVSSREMAIRFDEEAKNRSHSAIPFLANLILGPVSARLNEESLDISQIKIPPGQLGNLSERIADGTTSSLSAAQAVLPILWKGEGLVWNEKTIDAIIEERGLKQISDVGAIEKIVDEVLAANAKQVEDYRSGKEKAFNSLVGQVMKRSQGKANPAQVNEILRRKLK